MIKRSFLSFVLIFALLLFAFDRLAAHLHLPKEGSQQVVIYTTTWCPYCKALRNFLENYEISYTEHDTETSIQGIMGSWALRTRGVPVSVIGEQVVYGYDGEKLGWALEDAGYEIPQEF